jgi:predicted nucleic acid-binding Zn ribbon protein
MEGLVILMKRCEYCGKEISYHQQYCDEDCQREAIKFYDFREKFSMLFGIINCICLFAIPIGAIAFAFVDYLGLSIIACALLILGITVFFMPFPVENMLDKRKIKDAVKFTKILGIVLFCFGAIATIVDLILFL